MTVDTQHRVHKVTEQLRKVMREKRALDGITVQQLIQAAVTDEVPQIIKGLADLGFEDATSEKRPSRIPMSDRTIQQLKIASEITGIPATLLLQAALARYCGPLTPTEAKEAPKKAAPTKKATAASKTNRTQGKPKGTPRKTTKKATKKAAPKKVATKKASTRSRQTKKGGAK